MVFRFLNWVTHIITLYIAFLIIGKLSVGFYVTLTTRYLKYDVCVVNMSWKQAGFWFVLSRTSVFQSTDYSIDSNSP